MDQAARLERSYAPYAGPLFAFLLIASLTSDVAASATHWVLIAKAVVPAALVIYFLVRGAYPELRSWRAPARLWLLDVLVGVASAALWIVPYLVFSFDFGDGALSPFGPDRSKGFDPHVMGSEYATLLLGLRFVGFALVIPIVEELFVRSFVMRFVQEYETNKDFHTLPVGRYTRWSLWITALVFTLGHVPWEWWVALPWFVLTTLWFYKRRSIVSVIVVHAVANATIFWFAVTNGTAGPGMSPAWYFL